MDTWATNELLFYLATHLHDTACPLIPVKWSINQVSTAECRIECGKGWPFAKQADSAEDMFDCAFGCAEGRGEHRDAFPIERTGALWVLSLRLIYELIRDAENHRP